MNNKCTMWYILLQRRPYTRWYLSIAYLVFTYLTIVTVLYSSFEVNQFGVAGFIEADHSGGRGHRCALRRGPLHSKSPLNISGLLKRSRRRRRSLGPGLAPPHATRDATRVRHRPSCAPSPQVSLPVRLPLQRMCRVMACGGGQIYILTTNLREPASRSSGSTTPTSRCTTLTRLCR